MLRKKRGQIEIQFNWIFVLIAGALILAFFITIVNKQRDASALRTSASIATNLESIFTGAEISTNTVNVFDLPDTSVSFECGSFAIGSIRKETGDNVMFAPSTLSGRKMITWARDWSVPYRVMNFLYLTDPKIRYIIVHDDATLKLATTVFDDLPKEMNKEQKHVNDLAGLDYRNDPHVRFVFFGAENSQGVARLDAQGAEDEAVSAVAFLDLGSATTIGSLGLVRFFRKEGNLLQQAGVDTPYLREESFYGAVFAADEEQYSCQMRNAFSRLALVTKVYQERSKALQDELGTSHACFILHSPTPLEKIGEEAVKLSTGFPVALSANSPVNRIQERAVALQGTLNQQLQLLSCELIY